MLEANAGKPPEELLRNGSAVNSELSHMKEYYKGRNEEIEKLIEQVLQSQHE
jgi:hypothetical protein